MKRSDCPQCGRETSPAAGACPRCGHPSEPAEAARGRRPPKRAFRLLAIGGCGLATVLVGTVLSALLVPEFLDSLQKAKQKRTMSDLQEWSAAIEEYRGGHGGAVPQASDLDTLADLLGTEATAGLATADAWGTPIRYACWSEDLEIEGCDTYRLVSAGRDGVYELEEPAGYEAAVFDRLDYDADLVLGDGYFYRYPGPAGS